MEEEAGEFLLLGGERTGQNKSSMGPHGLTYAILKHWIKRGVREQCISETLIELSDI
jgi:hypothetical protein